MSPAWGISIKLLLFLCACKRYLSAISCQGVQSFHFGENGRFSKYDFVNNVLEKQLAKIMTDGENLYTQQENRQFLVLSAEKAWKRSGDRGRSKTFAYLII